MGSRVDAEDAMEKAKNCLMEKNYGEARTLMRKAMELSPDIENGVAVLVVCETLYYGLEMKFPNWGIDWYSVFHLHPSATHLEVNTQCENILKFIKDMRSKQRLLAEELFHKACDVLCDEASRLDYDRKRKNSGLIDVCSSKLTSSFRENYLGWKEPVFCSATDHCHSSKRSKPTQCDGEQLILFPDQKKVKTEVFDEMPQNPHFGPLNIYGGKVREGMKVGLNIAFANLSEEIYKLDNVESFWAGLDGFMDQLLQLAGMGYNVTKLKERLDNLKKFAEREQSLKDKEKYLETDIKSNEEMVERLRARMLTYENRIVESKSELDTVKKERVEAVDAFASALKSSRS